MRKVTFALLLLALTIILRSPALPWAAIEEDEACHFTGAVVVAEGGKPYKDVVDGKTPLLWYLFAAVVKLFGPFNTIAHRLFTDFNVWGSALLLWGLGTLIGNARAGRWGALFFTLFSTCSTYKILASNYELHLLPFDLLAFLSFTFGLKKQRPWFIALSGAAIATSFFIKQTAGINLATQALLLIFLFGWKGWRRFAIKALPLLFFGFGAALGLYLLWMYKTGALEPMLFWTWHYAWILTNKSMVTLPYFQRLLTREGAWIAGTLLIHFWAVRFIFDFLQSWRGASWTAETIAKGLLILWALLEWIPISLGGRFPIHYFLMYLPPLALLAGFWIARSETVELFFSKILNFRRFVFVAFFFLLPVVGTWMASWRVEWGNGLVDLKRVDYAKLARHIRRATQPDDRIFVWGHNPEFYVYAKRRPASRFLFLDFVTGRHGIPSRYVHPAQYDQYAIAEAWPMLFEDFDKHPPALIVDTSPADLHDYKVFPISRYPQLARYVQEFYRLGWVEEEVHFYVRK